MLSPRAPLVLFFMHVFLYRIPPTSFFAKSIISISNVHMLFKLFFPSMVMSFQCDFQCFKLLGGIVLASNKKGPPCWCGTTHWSQEKFRIWTISLVFLCYAPSSLLPFMFQRNLLLFLPPYLPCIFPFILLLYDSQSRFFLPFSSISNAPNSSICFSIFLGDFKSPRNIRIQMFKACWWCYWL